MGLDSVELIIKFENFFEVPIPDMEAEKIRTVQDAVNFFASRIKYVDRQIDIKKNILQRMVLSCSKLNIHSFVSGDQLIFDIIPFSEQELWKELQENAGFELPFPIYKGKFGKLVEKLFPTKINFENTTVDRFVDLICAINYKTVLIKGQIQNEYEILTGIMGMTIEISGINPFEVLPDKSFVNDFGID